MKEWRAVRNRVFSDCVYFEVRRAIFALRRSGLCAASELSLRSVGAIFARRSGLCAASERSLRSFGAVFARRSGLCLASESGIVFAAAAVDLSLAAV